jgi:hypothetical protein
MDETSVPIARNTIHGFGRRTRKNLMFILFAPNMGADVHIVTQLIISLQGLIVFPYEQLKRAGISFKDHKFKDLEERGWPKFVPFLGESSQLDDLLYHLRNAIAHRRVEFDSDSRVMSEVNISFWDRKPNALTDYWGMKINAEALYQFVLCFSKLIDPEDYALSIMRPINC